MGEKTLIIVRHGKATPRDELPALSEHGTDTDYQRTLTEKGMRQAGHLGRILAAAGQQVDLVMSSAAPRALETAMIISRHLKIESAVEADKAFYGCAAGDWISAIQARPEAPGTVMVVGHNPELEFLAARAGGRDDLVLPTGGTVRLSGLGEWSELGAAAMRVRAFVRPSDTMDLDLDTERLLKLWNGGET